MRLGDIAEVYRDGREFTPVREWKPGAGLVPGYGYPRRCWSREPVFTGGECVLITVNAPLDGVMGRVHYSVWLIEEGPCAYTPDVWRISLKPNADVSIGFLTDKLFWAANELHNIGAEDADVGVRKLLDFDIGHVETHGEETPYRPAYYYAEKYNDWPDMELDLPLGMPGLQCHYDHGDDNLMRVTFPYAGAKITIHCGYVTAKFTPWDILITDGETLTKWDLTFDGAESIHAILCEYGLEWSGGDPGKSFLAAALHEYIGGLCAEVKKLLPQPIAEEIRICLE